MTRRLVGAILGTALALAYAGTRSPASPAPNAEPRCRADARRFRHRGFANAETHYAGSDGTASLLHANSDHAVSQYDVACLQVTTHRP